MGYHYWLTTHDETGKPYLIYGGVNEEEARQKGLEMLGGLDFEIKRLPTRNLQRARSFMAGNRLEQYRDLRKANQRIGHEKSIKRLRHKYANNW